MTSPKYWTDTITTGRETSMSGIMCSEKDLTKISGLYETIGKAIENACEGITKEAEKEKILARIKGEAWTTKISSSDGENIGGLMFESKERRDAIVEFLDGIISIVGCDCGCQDGDSGDCCGDVSDSDSKAVSGSGSGSDAGDAYKRGITVSPDAGSDGRFNNGKLSGGEYQKPTITGEESVSKTLATDTVSLSGKDSDAKNDTKDTSKDTKDSNSEKTKSKVVRL